MGSYPDKSGGHGVTGVPGHFADDSGDGSDNPKVGSASHESSDVNPPNHDFHNELHAFKGFKQVQCD